MGTVCVIGGGPAGVGAAAEAAAEGSKVTLMEGSQDLREVDEWRACSDPFPSVPVGSSERLASLGVEVRVGRRVTSIGPGCRVHASGCERFDSVVVATGSSHVVEPFEGRKKSGVFAMATRSSHESFAARLARRPSVVVSGGGLAAMRLADQAIQAGAAVILLLSPGAGDAGIGPWLSGPLIEGAKLRGVSVVYGRLERALGTGSVEAVLAARRVFPCDCLAVVPRAFPAPPHGMVLTPRGRIAVGRRLETSLDRVFAAGECAESDAGQLVPEPPIPSAAEASGRVAGANASGRSFAFTPLRAYAVALFGLRVGCAGMSEVEARGAGFVPCEISKMWSPTDGCSVVFDRASGITLGVQTLGEAATDCILPAAFAVSQLTPLRSFVAPGRLGSIDISPIAETVREALRRR